MVINKNKEQEKLITINHIDELFSEINLDYTKLSVIDAGDNIHFEYNFPISPDKYLIFAKQDLEEDSIRGNINALSNAKRCIDCLIELSLKSLKIDPNTSISSLLEFCNSVLSVKDKNIQPYSLKVFCALSIAPSFLISEVRGLRNKVEHNYEIPKKDEVIKAIEIAELLLNQVKSKQASFASYAITDKKNNYDRKKIVFLEHYTPETLKNNSKILEFKLLATSDNGEKYVYHIKGDEQIYYYFLRAGFTQWGDSHQLKEAIINIIDSLKTSTPRKYINVTT